MSTSRNNIVRSPAPGSVFPDASKLVDATVTYNQGDLLIYDAATNLIRKPTTEAECSSFLGVAISKVVAGKIPAPYVTDVDASSMLGDVPGPRHGVVCKLIAKTGDAFDPGQTVFGDPATGAQNVQTAGTKSIGVYQGPVIASAAAGQEIEVLLGHRYPNDALVIP